MNPYALGWDIHRKFSKVSLTPISAGGNRLTLLTVGEWFFTCFRGVAVRGSNKTP